MIIKLIVYRHFNMFLFVIIIYNYLLILKYIINNILLLITACKVKVRTITEYFDISVILHESRIMTNESYTMYCVYNL